MTPERVLSDLERLIGTARWFGGKGRPFRVAGVRRAGELGAPGDGVRAVVELVTIAYLDDLGGEELYQVPLALRTEPEARLEHAFVGHWDEHHVYDAVHDRDAMGLWLAGFLSDDITAGDLLFHRVTDDSLDPHAQGSLLSAEQSNSSVAFGEEALMKVFRKVTPGINPDVQVHDVLTRAGSDHVAALYGWLDVVDGEPTSDSPTGEGAVIQLAMLQQFLRTASDGWELARASVRSLLAEADLHAYEVGSDFAAEAARLGIALAETHATLAEHFPVEHWDKDATDGVAAAMHERLDEAVRAVPALASYADGLRPTFAALTDVSELTVQRIHGDLHLGQTLRTVKGWKLVDFEGEPAKPLADRLLPDPVWRDVAGMLRSFDYAGAVVQRELDAAEPEVEAQRQHRAREWSERNRTAFLTAYAGGDLTPEARLLLNAYEADKAVYECVYEARNRPGWVDIPLAAVARLVAVPSGADAE